MGQGLDWLIFGQGLIGFSGFRRCCLLVELRFFHFEWCSIFLFWPPFWSSASLFLLFGFGDLDLEVSFGGGSLNGGVQWLQWRIFSLGNCLWSRLAMVLISFEGVIYLVLMVFYNW